MKRLNSKLEQKLRAAEYRLKQALHIGDARRIAFAHHRLRDTSVNLRAQNFWIGKSARLRQVVALLASADKLIGDYRAMSRAGEENIFADEIYFVSPIKAVSVKRPQQLPRAVLK